MKTKTEWNSADFLTRSCCPWCRSNKSEVFYKIGNLEESIECEFGRIIDIKKCLNCGMVYSSEILSNSGKNKYWSNYSSRIHESDVEKNKKRNEMYLLEYEYIKQFLNLNKKNMVLDIGCGEGKFLDYFSEECNCYGIEIGKEAVEKASKKHNVIEGEIDKLNIDKKFDLIILRGIIQYFDDPYKCFNIISDLVNSQGLIYITSTPNADSVLFNLFKEHFTLPVNEVSCNGFNSNLLDKFFAEKDFSCVGNRSIYLNTPYEDFENDILKIATAIKAKKEGLGIDFKAPAFFDNMLCLVYRKDY